MKGWDSLKAGTTKRTHFDVLELWGHIPVLTFPRMKMVFVKTQFGAPGWLSQLSI